MVELVTDYLEGALDEAPRARFDEHLKTCDGCAAFLDQLRAGLRTIGTLRVEQLDPVFRGRLLEAFDEATRAR